MLRESKTSIKAKKLQRNKQQWYIQTNNQNAKNKDDLKVTTESEPVNFLPVNIYQLLQRTWIDGRCIK